MCGFPFSRSVLSFLDPIGTCAPWKLVLREGGRRFKDALRCCVLRDKKVQEVQKSLGVLPTKRLWSLSLGDQGHVLRGGGFDMDIQDP